MTAPALGRPQLAVGRHASVQLRFHRRRAVEKGRRVYDNLIKSLAFEGKEPNIMKRTPRDPGAPVLSGFVVMRTFVVAILMTAGAIGLFLYEFRGAGAEALAKAQTMAVTTAIMF